MIVIGAGHAGCEAALAAARAGCTVLVLTPNLDRVGFMPCNPSIGGPGKSHLVAEVDALGGEMARAADRTALQVRCLNTSKGPAVQSVRTQQDKGLYAIAIKEALEHQPGLDLVQDEVLALSIGRCNGAPAVDGVLAKLLGSVQAECVVVTAGTFLRGALIAGEQRAAGGRAGDRADAALAKSLAGLGFCLRRLKTGTPPRIDARTVDLALCELQRGSDDPIWLSRDGVRGRIEPLTMPPAPVLAPHASAGWRPQLACFRLSTNPATHDVIRANLHRAPMFNGTIEGIGPRYCPSVEHKVARFAEKPSHPVFLEPEGWLTSELYVQGMSTSLPPDVQEAALRTIPALCDVRITRYGYAVEYDAVDPAELSTSLESQRVPGLFLAGQVNGTSGYEEAAAQGILAGINAAAKVQGRQALILGRDRAYIGVLIDDLIKKPFEEPYRMLTSRAEFRLSLRTTTADARLAELAYQANAIDESRVADVRREQAAVDACLHALANCRCPPTPKWIAAFAASGLASVARPMTAADVLRRPGASLAQVGKALEHAGESLSVPSGAWFQTAVEEEVKYAAFIERERREVARLAALNERILPTTFDFSGVPGLRTEAAEKLAARRPRTLGEAARLSGVTPADVAALMVHSTRTHAAPT